MAWTFDPSLSDDLDKVRMTIADVVETDPLFQDETINAFLTTEGSVNGAALKLAESLAFRFARDRNKKVGAMSLSGNRSEFYLALIKQLRRAVSLGAAPYCGGISKADKRTHEQNSDRVEPIFTRGQFSHPEVDQTELAEE